MTDRRLLLVRHGVTDWNREGRFQGHLDPPLADDGRMEAELLGARLRADPGLHPARVISSTLRRAMQTAEAIATAAGTHVVPDARLIEIGQGDWQGRTHADLALNDAERYADWRRDAGIRQPPGGEPIEEATRRVTELLGELEAGATRDRWPVCIVSHGGTLRILARVLLEASTSASWALDVDNASLGICTASDRGWRLDRWNDTLHLLGHTATHVDELEGRPLAL